MADPPAGSFFVCDPAGDVVAGFETFEEAQMLADRRASAARLPGPHGACWEVLRHPERRWRRGVLHRAYPSPAGREGGGSGGGPSGVREPRRPHPSSSSGAVSLDQPE
jgi:hypothetical protein